MKKTPAVCSSLLIIVLILSSFSNRDWIWFNKDDYKISFPGDPSTDSTVQETKLGPITVFTHSFESAEDVNDSNLVYIAVVTHYPPQFANTTDKAFIAGFFSGAVKSAVSSMPGKLISEKEIKLNDYPGREIKVDYGDGAAIVTMRIILVKDRVFGIQTIALPGKEDNSTALRYFDSFNVK